MEDSNYGNKGANNGFLYLLLVLVIVVSVGALGYTYIYMNNPKNIYGQSVVGGRAVVSGFGLIKK